MLSDEIRDLLQPVVRTQKVIWFAFIITIPLYIGLAYLVTNNAENTSSVSKTLEVILYAVSVVTAGGSIVYRRYIFSDAHLQKKIREEANPLQLAMDSKTGHVDPERLRRIESLVPFEQKILGLVVSLQVFNIISWALNESIAIYGLMLMFLSRNFSALFPFMLAAMILDLLMSPGTESVVERAQQFVG